MLCAHLCVCVCVRNISIFANGKPKSIHTYDPSHNLKTEILSVFPISSFGYTIWVLCEYLSALHIGRSLLILRTNTHDWNNIFNSRVPSQPASTVVYPRTKIMHIFYNHDILKLIQPTICNWLQIHRDMEESVRGSHTPFVMCTKRKWFQKSVHLKMIFYPISGFLSPPTLSYAPICRNSFQPPPLIVFRSNFMAMYRIIRILVSSSSSSPSSS